MKFGLISVALLAVAALPAMEKAYWPFKLALEKGPAGGGGVLVVPPPPHAAA